MDRIDRGRRHLKSIRVRRRERRHLKSIRARLQDLALQGRPAIMDRIDRGRRHLKSIRARLQDLALQERPAIMDRIDWGRRHLKSIRAHWCQVRRLNLALYRNIELLLLRNSSLRPGVVKAQPTSPFISRRF